jgi:hypothetical protein
MLGIRQPMDGPVFGEAGGCAKLVYSRHDQSLRPTAGHVGRAHRAVQGPGRLRSAAGPRLLRDVTRICEEVGRECKDQP